MPEADSRNSELFILDITMLMQVIFLAIFVVFVVANGDEEIWRKECGIENESAENEKIKDPDPCQYECYLKKVNFLVDGKINFNQMLTESKKHNSAEKAEEMMATIQKKFAETEYKGSSPCAVAGRLLATLKIINDRGNLNDDKEKE